MTLDRDIRFTPDQITATQRAVRAEIAVRTRSICKAEAAREAGQKIQQGVLDGHYSALTELRNVATNLEVARIQIARRLADKIA